MSVRNEKKYKTRRSYQLGYDNGFCGVMDRPDWTRDDRWSTNYDIGYADGAMDAASEAREAATRAALSYPFDCLRERVGLSVQDDDLREVLIDLIDRVERLAGDD